MGNICRSPAAEAILKKKLKDANLAERFFVDSAGTIDYHTGELPDSRMIDCGNRRGYTLDHHARKFSPQKDFDKFNLIITMDEENHSAIIRWDSENKFCLKVKKAKDYLKNFIVNEVPDPYYGDESDFDKVIDILEDACDGILEELKNDNTQYSNKD